MPKPSVIPKLERDYGKPIREIIAETLRSTDGNVREAAEKLGVPMGTLSFWMLKFGVRRLVSISLV